MKRISLRRMRSTAGSSGFSSLSSFNAGLAMEEYP
jgi:hypothetical protein